MHDTRKPRTSKEICCCVDFAGDEQSCPIHGRDAGAVMTRKRILWVVAVLLVWLVATLLEPVMSVWLWSLILIVLMVLALYGAERLV